MSSNKKKLIIQFAKNKIKCGVVVTGEKPKVEDVLEFVLFNENLEEELGKIKEHYKLEEARILLDDELSTIIETSIPKDVENERSFIGIRIAEKIPNVIEGKDWDYKEIGQTKNEKLIKVVVPLDGYLKNILTTSAKVGLIITAVEPLSLAGERNKDPMIGLAIKTDIKGRDEQILNLVREILPEEVNIDVPKEEPKIEELKKEEIFKGEEVKVEIKEDVLPNQVEKIEEVKVEEIEVKPPPEEEKVSKKKIIFLIFIFIFLGSLVAGGIIVYKRSISGLETQNNTGNPSTITPTQAVTPTPVELKKSDLKISIENGSGKSGVALEAKQLLEGLGYKIEKTGNAKAYNYQETEISIKESKKSYLKSLSESLSEKYSVSTASSILDEANQFDTIVIVGKK